MEKDSEFNNYKSRTKEGKLGMAIVGAISSDPRLVSLYSISLPLGRNLEHFLTKKRHLFKVYTELFKNVRELGRSAKA
jgi:hypothetical protein